MKSILNIARSELRYYYHSPVAWFILIFFLFVNGGLLFMSLEGLAITQASISKLVGSRFEGFIGSSQTHLLIVNSIGVMDKLFFLFVPLLTMNIVNKEYTNGTIKLLTSSPVSIRQIVLGKYLGSLSFLLILFFVYATVCLFSVSFINNAPLSFVFTTLFAFVLVSIVYVAIGIFLSSVTSYQIFAAILTFTVLFFFADLHTYFQKYDHLRDVLYFLGIGGRVEKVLGGMITSRDIVYFLVIAGMFVSFTIIRINSIYKSSNWKFNTVRYCGTFAITIVILVLSSQPGYIGYYDSTPNKVNTIHPTTQDLFSKLDGSEIKVTSYGSLFRKNINLGLPEYRNSGKWTFWEKHLRFYPNMSFDYVNFYDYADSDTTLKKYYPGKSIAFIAQKIAEGIGADIRQFLTPQEIRKLIDFSFKEDCLVYTLEYKGKTVLLRTFSGKDAYPKDIHMSAALEYLLVDTFPRIKFLTGHFERAPFREGGRDYYSHIADPANESALINYNLFTDTIHNINLSEFNPEDVLVVADPKTALSPSLLDSIKKYIDAGRNAILLTEPNKHEIINPILNYLGLQAEPGTLVWQNPQDLPTNLYVSEAAATKYLAGEPYLYYLGKKLVDSLPMLVNSVTHLSVVNNTFKVDTILRIKSKNFNLWSERGMLVVDSASPTYDPHELDYRQDRDYLITAQLSRMINGREQRIIVMGDSDFMSSNRGNGQFLGNAFYSYVLNNKYPLYTNLDLPLDTTINLKPQTATVLKTFFLWILPSLLVLLALVFLVRRKRR